MLHTHFPKTFCSPVVEQLETNCGLKLVELETTRFRPFVHVTDMYSNHLRPLKAT